MTARTTKAKAKSTVTDVPYVETVQPMAAEATFFERLRADLGVNPQVTWQRAAIGWVTSLLVCGVLGYLAGYILAYITIAALLLSGSAFIAMLIYVLGMIAIFYMGYRVGPVVYLAVIDKSVDRAFDTAKSWVSGLFTTPGVTA